MAGILLQQGLGLGPEPMDLRIRGGRIVEIAPGLKPQGEVVYDVANHWISPPLVESHIHLDSVLTSGEPRHNQSGTLWEGIQLWTERKPSLTFEDVERRALTALRLMATQGVLYVRTHVDITGPNLVALEALLSVQKQVQPWITLQIVAFPQDGVYGKPEHLALMEQALRLGCGVIGGIPHYELTREEGVESVRQIFGLAERYEALIDIHCDETDDDQSRFLEVISAQALRRNWGSRVTASHTTAFHSYNNAYALKLMGFLQRSQINLVANPLINITLQGRTDTYPKRRGMTRIKELWQAGVNVSLGQDCICDPWYPLGTGSPLGAAHMAAHVGQMMGQGELAACFAMITTHGAKTLSIKDYGIRLGNPASLIVLNAPSPQECLRTQPVARLVIAHGDVICESQPAQAQLRVNF